MELLPDVIGLFGGYEATYGSLAGVMVALLFFFVIGLGVVAGAELNAALVEPGGKALRGEALRGAVRERSCPSRSRLRKKISCAKSAGIKGNSRWAASCRASAG